MIQTFTTDGPTQQFNCHAQDVNINYKSKLSTFLPLLGLLNSPPCLLEDSQDSQLPTVNKGQTFSWEFRMPLKVGRKPYQTGGPLRGRGLDIKRIYGAS